MAANSTTISDEDETDFDKKRTESLTKPDVKDMFQKLGSKLGWFQYGDLDTALKTLSKSSKKKATKARRHFKSKADQDLDEADKENASPSTFVKDKSLRKPNILSSLKSFNEDKYVSSVPVRKSKACTDLTKEGKTNVFLSPTVRPVKDGCPDNDSFEQLNIKDPHTKSDSPNAFQIISGKNSPESDQSANIHHPNLNTSASSSSSSASSVEVLDVSVQTGEHDREPQEPVISPYNRSLVMCHGGSPQEPKTKSPETNALFSDSYNRSLVKGYEGPLQESKSVEMNASLSDSSYENSDGMPAPSPASCSPASSSSVEVVDVSLQTSPVPLASGLELNVIAEENHQHDTDNSPFHQRKAQASVEDEFNNLSECDNFPDFPVFPQKDLNGKQDVRKREPSVYFDAVTEMKSSQPRDYRSREKSIYFDASESLLPKSSDSAVVSEKGDNPGNCQFFSESDDDYCVVSKKDQDAGFGQTKTFTPPQSRNNWRSTKFEDSSSDDDFESFLQSVKTSSSREIIEEDSNQASLEEFIVNDSDVSSQSDDDLFYLGVTQESPPLKPLYKPPSPKKTIELSDSEEEFKTPLPVQKKKKAVLPSPKTQEKFSFLKSLSENVPKHQCDPVAYRYVESFKKTKEELASYLFQMFNKNVFDSKLPADLPIIWNKRLLKTAGYCVNILKKVGQHERSARIELSTKVCDSAQRLRDTLIHELCHAAVWLINGTKGGHGPYWKYWALKANKRFPEIPVIARCHDYTITTKYTYQCTQCGYRVGRHSKSLDTDRKVCGYCRGRFELLQGGSSSGGSTPRTPRTPNKFALFVKEKYAEVKSRETTLQHKDVMKILSEEFAKSKISS